MVFKSLPIQFDAYGRAHLRDEQAESPFDFTDLPRLQRTQNRERALEKLSDQNGVRVFAIDPLTRVSNSLSVQTLIDFEQRRVLDARVEASKYTGLDLTLKGRRPSDAVPLTSRMSGTSSGAHSIASSMALEMAGGVIPPPFAVIARNLGACGEMLGESTRHLFLMAGPDYSEAAVSRTSLSLWGKAQSTASPNAHIHGLDKIADIMRGMNPMSGHLYLESLQMSRIAAEIATMIFGKYPHPTTIFPGGIAIEANRETFNQILGRVNTFIDYAKKVAAIWDDLVEFFYAAEPRYRRVGELPGNLLSVGIWDDPDIYDASYGNCNYWGERRLSTPGVVINGQRRTNRLSDLNIGIEEFVNHSFFEHWNHQKFQADPLSGPLSPWHPWNKETIPRPLDRDWKSIYSWNPSPRWDREPMETGPIARLWADAAYPTHNCDFVRQDGNGLEIDLPQGQRPATTLQWRMPERPNALERNRARAYYIGFTGIAAYTNLLEAFDCVRRGETTLSNRFQFPDKSIGVGFWESSSGTLTHHVVIRDNEIENYQVITPGEWMGSPRDSSGVPGIYEAALMNTPLLEECARAEYFTGIDILRVIRSFDP